MAPVGARAPRGRILEARLLYRAPVITYYMFATMMILLTLLAFASEPNADGTHLEPSPRVAAQLEAIRNHAGDAKRPFYFGVFLHHLLSGFYALGLRLGLNFAGIQAICVAAWAAHVAEAVYAYRLCVYGSATKLTTAVYVLVTFIGGFGQILTLKQAVARVEEERERRHQ